MLTFLQSLIGNLFSGICIGLKLGLEWCKSYCGLPSNVLLYYKDDTSATLFYYGISR